MAKNELVSLALISNGPLHAYGLNNIVRDMDLEKMAKISPASIYSALTRLKNDGCVDVTSKQVGNMPARKVYTITQKGQARLEEELANAILSTDTGENSMNLAVNFAFGLPADDIISLLNIRIKNFESSILKLEKRKKEMARCGLLQAVISINGLIKHQKVEIDMAKEFIELLRKEPDFFIHKGKELMTCYV